MKILKVLSFVLFLTACAHQESESMAKATSTAPSPVTKEAVAAVDLHRNVVVTLDFAVGQTGLSDEATRELQAALDGVRKDGKITNIEVAAWSDQQYPLAGKKLSQEQVKLAKERGQTLEKLLKKSESGAKVHTFNMAKQPNKFQKWIGTRDDAVKSKLASAGIVARDSSDITPDRKSVGMIFIEIE